MRSLPLSCQPGASPSPSFTSCAGSFRDGSDSPREFLERCIARIEALEPHINAFVHLDLDAARQAADESSRRHRAGRPLSDIDGMPIGIKDIIETRDMPTAMNSPIYTGFRPRRDAACVVALKHAGAVIVGKTVTTEFACGRSGPTRNPFDLTRTPGGSSSGSAAAVGAGMLPAALGTQTQASIIRPASYCGTIGWKPSYGALSFDGIASLSGTLDHLGVLAQSLDDAWAVATAIAAATSIPDSGAALPQPKRPKRLVKLETAAWTETDASSRDAFDAALQALQRAGVDLLDRSDPRIDALERRLADAPDIAYRIFAWEAQWPLRAYQACGSDLIGEQIEDLIAAASRMTQADYQIALQSRADLQRAVGALSEDIDGFLTFASSGPASVGLEHTGSRLFPVTWTLLGGPSLSLPVLSVAGLPLGLQLMGFAHADAGTVATARWIMTCLRAQEGICVS
jgi:Asp-tRNA(Asn)/Glu-tRNA(Gln) amidotransferase A subunit family amidase